MCGRQSAGSLYAFSNFQAADAVIGQADMTSNSVNQGGNPHPHPNRHLDTDLNSNLDNYSDPDGN